MVPYNWSNIVRKNGHSVREINGENFVVNFHRFILMYQYSSWCLHFKAQAPCYTKLSTEVSHTECDKLTNNTARIAGLHVQASLLLKMVHTVL